MDDYVRATIVVAVVFVTSLVGLLPATIAAQKGRSFLVWWLFGTALVPIALPWAFFLRTRDGIETSSLTETGDPNVR
ncbi:MAG TPA: hypothetical protein VN805_18010 [Caulobacteraceae bacterium]|nr:hypothetical protein [Caulobacteraceae bacterium]